MLASQAFWPLVFVWQLRDAGGSGAIRMTVSGPRKNNPKALGDASCPGSCLGAGAFPANLLTQRRPVWPALGWQEIRVFRAAEALQLAGFALCWFLYLLGPAGIHPGSHLFFGPAAIARAESASPIKPARAHLPLPPLGRQPVLLLRPAVFLAYGLLRASIGRTEGLRVRQSHGVDALGSRVRRAHRGAWTLSA